MSNQKLYLCVTRGDKHDPTCYDVNDDKTWKETLEAIELELDDYYCDNGDKRDGMSVKIEFKMMSPDDIIED